MELNTINLSIENNFDNLKIKFQENTSENVKTRREIVTKIHEEAVMNPDEMKNFFYMLAGMQVENSNLKDIIKTDYIHWA